MKVPLFTCIWTGKRVQEFANTGRLLGLNPKISFRHPSDCLWTVGVRLLYRKVIERKLTALGNIEFTEARFVKNELLNEFSLSLESSYNLCIPK